MVEGVSNRQALGMGEACQRERRRPPTEEDGPPQVSCCQPRRQQISTFVEATVADRMLPRHVSKCHPPRQRRQRRI